MIKLWLIALLLSGLNQNNANAALLYKLGFVDLVKIEEIKQNDETKETWDFKEFIASFTSRPLRQGGPRLRLIELSMDSPKEKYDVDFLLVTGALSETRKVATKFREAGGKVLISTEWSREEIGISGLDVITPFLPVERRIPALAKWLEQKKHKSVHFLQRKDSDFDAIWFYEAGAAFKKLKIKTHKVIVGEKLEKCKVGVLLEFSPDIDTKINCEYLVWMQDPYHSSHVDAYRKRITDSAKVEFYFSQFADGVSGPAREFVYKSNNRYQLALVYDALQILVKAVNRTKFTINTSKRLFHAINGIEIESGTGKLKVSDGKVYREVFVVKSYKEDRVLDWRSGLLER